MEFSQSLDLEFEKAVANSKASKPNFELLIELLQKGAHIDGAQRNGLPLRHAVTKMSVALIHFLVGAGANVNARMPARGRIEGLNREQPHFNADTILHWAAHRSAVKKARDFDALAHAQVIVELIALGASPETRSMHEMRPEELIEEKGPKILKLAITHPIHAAIKLHNPSLCMRLLDRGFDPEVKSPARQTAWRLAEISSPNCLAAMRSWQAKTAMNRMLDEINFNGKKP